MKPSIESEGIGQNRINEFCLDNNIMVIILSHEPIANRVLTSDSKVINVFSCSDYCG
jgi:hypothetical protein